MDWNILKEIFSTLSDAAILAITIYTFYLTIKPRVKLIGMRHAYGGIEGDIISVSLENKSLSPISIKKISIIFDNYDMPIFSKGDNDEECIIEGFKTKTISMEPYSSVTLDKDYFNLPKLNIRYIRIETSRNIQYIKVLPKECNVFLKHSEKKKTLQQVLVSRTRFNGVVLKPHMKYALLFSNEHNIPKTIIISETGMLSDSVFGFNMLSPDIEITKDNLENFFKNYFKDKKFSITKIN